MAEQISLKATGTRNIIRSTFIPPKPFEHSFTCNAGEVIPAFCTTEIMPHDTWKFKINCLVRYNSAAKHPTMGRVYYAWAAYYTPHQQIWDNWNALMGEVKDAAWVSQTDYSVPQIEIPENAPIEFNTILDHFAWRPGIGGFSGSALKIRHYCHICNEWLRDPNIEEPIQFLTTDDSITYVTSGDFRTGGTPYKINRMADYYSTCLPEPQRGDPVTLPLGVSAPVMTESNNTTRLVVSDSSSGGGKTIASISYGGGSYGSTQDAKAYLIGTGGSSVDTNLYADLTQASAIDIETVRKAAITQQIFELDARAGSRAPEMLWARWGVEVDELELGRPRLLCSAEEQIGINQVPQTSGTTETTDLGDLAAFGYGANQGEWNTHSFKYHGCLMILFWVRTEHKYQYGIPREDMKKTRFEFWHPEMDGEGDQPVYDYEIFATAENINNPTVFGYQMRGAEYKMFPSIISGELRSEYPQSLDTWHFADKYDSQPTLSKEWMKETPENIDRTITVTSEVTKQFIVDFAMEMELTRAMRAHSIPGIERI